MAIWRPTQHPVSWKKAVNILLQIRHHARPNVIVLQPGLEPFLAKDNPRALTLSLARHPVLLRNRFRKEGA